MLICFRSRNANTAPLTVVSTVDVNHACDEDQFAFVVLQEKANKYVYSVLALVH